MKILFISTTYPTPVRPRQGAFNKVLVDALRARHEVRVVAPIPWTQYRGRQKPRDLDIQAHHPLFLFPPKLLRRHYGRLYWHSIRRTIHRLSASFTPDVVVGYWLHPDGYAATIAARYFNAACVVMSGGTDLRVLAKTPHRRKKIQQVLQCADRLVVVSHDLARQALALGGRDAEIDVIYRGIDRNCFHASDSYEARRELGLSNSAVVLLWIGRFEPLKNPLLLLTAARHWQQHWNGRLRIVMIGDGSLRSQIFRQIDSSNLRDVIQVVTPMTQSQLSRYYHAADVTVLTSHSEGIPNVLLESICCDTPFVATQVGGVAEIASPGVDRLVPTNDAESLAKAVIELVEKQPMGPRTFVPFDTQRAAAEFENALGRAMLARNGTNINLRPADAA